MSAVKAVDLPVVLQTEGKHLNDLTESDREEDSEWEWEWESESE